ISLIDRIGILGILGAVGATRKQISRVIRSEVFFITALALPIGIILGYMASYIIVPKIGVAGLKFTSSILVPIIAIVTTFITTLIALALPVRKVSKISPKEAMNNGFKEEIKNNKRKEFKDISILKLAFINLCR
ncbi:ABC transporter permease, partial [Enterobacter quasiroggenkampii]|nr:ABC transporter permease [Enterobacter quasiroggenkampii]